MRVFIACIAILFLTISLSVETVIAQESTSSAQVSGGQLDEALLKTVPIRFLPSQSLYFLITIKENINRFFRPSAAERSEFDFILAGKRLKETYLLIEENELGQAEKNLLRYASRLVKMTEQIEKARSQNQDVAKQIAHISDGFQFHETFLTYFSMGSEISQEVSKSIEAFGNAVVAVDKINPGIKNRFKILKINEESASPSPSPTFTPNLYEASPAARPRRIIL